MAALPLGAEDRPGPFEWQDLDGGVHRSEDLAGHITALVFVSSHCPVAVAYGPRLKQLVARFEPKGVRFLFLVPNGNETSAELREYSRRAQLTYPLYRDTDATIAAKLGVEATPEVRVLDRDGLVRYRGAIDDAQNPARVKVKGLEWALEDLLAGRTVSRPETKAFGCTIKRRRTDDSNRRALEEL
jgi:peroxiredoxin